MYSLVNCDIFTGDEFLYDSAVIIEKRKISQVVKESELSKDIEKIDLKGKTIAPGFFDVQVNGGGGTLFNDTPSVEGIRSIFEGHKQFGTTDFLPTFITGSSKGMLEASNAVNACLDNRLHGVRGIHFEGPFLNAKKAGVHDKSYVREINNSDLEIIKSVKSGVTLLTVAPEYVPNDHIKDMVANDIFISLGHTDASYEEASEALASGAKCTTHLFNAMTALGSRAPGVVGAALDDTKSWMGIIVDGHHVSFPSARIAIRAKEKGKTILVTDAMPPVGGNGEGFTLGDYEIEVKNGQCITMGDVLAGSALDMASAVRNSIQQLGIDKGEALRMASRYPAEFLDLSHRIGSISAGFDANIAIFDNQINVSGVVILGELEMSQH